MLDAFTEKSSRQVEELIKTAEALIRGKGVPSSLNDLFSRLRLRMTKAGSHIRNLEDVESALEECKKELVNFGSGFPELSGIGELPDAFRARDMIITEFVYLSAIREYILKGGKSRGSYLIRDDTGKLPVPGLPEEFRYSLDNGELMKQVCEICLKKEDGAYSCQTEWKRVRPVPGEDNWFENVWNEYMKGEIVR